MGRSRDLPCRKPWDLDKEEANIKGNHLRITNIEKVRPMKGNYIATACNTSFELWDHSSGGAGTARNEPSGKGKWKSGEAFSWEFLEGELPCKTQNKRVNSNFESSVKGHNDHRKINREVQDSMFGQGQE